jgi:hypothetical protein
MTSTKTMISTDWPSWSLNQTPCDLVRYVLPEVVRQHVTPEELHVSGCSADVGWLGPARGPAPW